MNPIQAVHDILRDGLTYAGAAVGLTVPQLQELGCPREDAVELAAVARGFFGETPFTRLQARARAAAAHHHFHALVLIESYVGRLRNSRLQARLRLELAGLDDAAAIRALAPRRLAQLKKTRDPRDGISMAFLRAHKARISIVADRGRAADIKAMLGDTIDAAEAALTAGGAAKPALLTHIVVDLPTGLKFAYQHGDEVYYTATNGGLYSGKEIVERAFAEYNYVTLVDPERGPANLYREARQASDKQRSMAYTEQRTCLLCNKPVEQSQMHHILAWSQGGETNPENLCLLCGRHNGLNDDTRSGRRGHIERRGGRLVYIPPGG